MVRVMISGASGQIGTHLISAIQNSNLTLASLGRQKLAQGNWHTNVEEFMINDYEINEVFDAINQFKPDVFVNLASISSVAICEQNPQLSKLVNLDFPLSILEFIRRGNIGDCMFVQASSSEMYAGTSHQSISELSQLNPKSTYGKHKAEVHQNLSLYRNFYKVRTSGVILFNNESKLRDERFASKRIIRDLVKVRNGIISDFRMGSDYVLRDWNHPFDTSQALKSIIMAGSPVDYVVGSGVLHTVGDLIAEACNLLNMNLSRINVVRDPGLVRSFENHGLRANSAKIRRDLNWSPKYTFKEIIEELVLNELERWN